MNPGVKTTDAASCPNSQRIWKGRCVDRHLRDEWLEKLNSLKAFELISICEGHPDNPRQPNPRMNLRLKKDLIGYVADRWLNLKSDLGREFTICFSDKETNPSIDLRRVIRRDWDSPSQEDDIIVYLDSKILSTDDPIMEKTIAWFERTIDSLEEFDANFESIVRIESSGRPGNLKVRGEDCTHRSPGRAGK